MATMVATAPLRLLAPLRSPHHTHNLLGAATGAMNYYTHTPFQTLNFVLIELLWTNSPFMELDFLSCLYHPCYSLYFLDSPHCLITPFPSTASFTFRKSLFPVRFVGS